MTQQTMTERDGYLATFRREHDTTLRLLRAFPADQIGLKPNDKLQSAGDIGWMLVLNQMVVPPIVEQAELLPQAFPKLPPTWKAIVDTFETTHRDVVATLERRLDDHTINQTIKTLVGPKQMGDVRRGDMLWMMLYDSIHHRGQLSIYTRLAGGKVPSIYGPTLEEPWW
jgi:uncharacterized damage-inducible protein DinB